jgi:3-oxosteroid 1-dehydrogenase
VTSGYDLVCLGAGIGGMTAAITAHDHGLRPIVLEKSDQLGGVAAYSAGQLWAADTYLAHEAGLQDSWQEGFAYLDWLADGTADHDMLETFCRTAPEVFAFMHREAGVEWRLLDLADNHWPDAPGTKERGRFIEPAGIPGDRLPPEWRDLVRRSATSLFSNHEVAYELGGSANRATWDPELTAQRQRQDLRHQGSALAAYLVIAVHERGIPMLTDVDVTELILEDGRVGGVVATIDGEPQRLRAARGVLIAMGGYDWNPELVLRFDQRTNFGSRAPRSVMGDHFALVEGLDPAIMTLPRASGLGYKEPAEQTEDHRDHWHPFSSGWPHAMVVNRAGRRFGDESRSGGGQGPHRPATVAALDLDAGGQPVNMPCWGIFDSQYRAKYPIGRGGPDAPLPAPFVSAPTVEELAERLGIDPAGLAATLADFNRHARDGRDPAFARGTNRWAHSQQGDPRMSPNPNLGPLDVGPFYGVPLTFVAAALTQAGLRTDTSARVMDIDGRPISGLYASGNSMAWRDLGSVYQSGTSNARGMVWGYIAARHAARG